MKPLDPSITAEQIREALHAAADPVKAQGMQRFFKTGAGQYGEGDRFLGLPNPVTRSFVRLYRQAPTAEAVALLASPWHEIRACGLLILVEQYSRGGEELRENIYQAYLAHTGRINNWDLVDLSAPDIVGEHLLRRERDTLYRLAAGTQLWEQRIAMIATLTFIRHGDFADTLRLAEYFLPHRHDLMHKAVGWMLRETGKRDRAVLTAFLQRHKTAMPRTALRYAIEHYPEAERREFMRKDA